MSAFYVRDRVLATDARHVRRIVLSTGFFSAEEIDVAEELVLEHLAKGMASGYLFVFVHQEDDECPVAYACYGPVPCTQQSFDLYWIAVRSDMQGQKLGRMVLREVELRLREIGGGKLIAETSSREQYAPTRQFYLHCDFAEEARIRDYYSAGEDNIYYTKVIEG